MIRLPAALVRELGRKATAPKVLNSTDAPKDTKPSVKTTRARVKPSKAVQTDTPKKSGRMPGGTETGRLDFTLSIRPRPKERARTYADKGALLSAFRAAKGDPQRFMALVAGNTMRSMTPEATRIFESAIAMGGRAAMIRAGLTPFLGPVLMRLLFVLPGDEAEWPTAQQDGDLDNIEKAVLDGLNGVAWTDDRQVVGKSARKVTGPVACVQIRIWPAPAARPVRGIPRS